MTLPIWPATLPRPERQTFRLTPQDVRKKRNNEAGPPTYRRRQSGFALNVNLSLILTLRQRARFDAFYFDETASGSKPFYMPDPTRDGGLIATADDSLLITGAGQTLAVSARWLCLFGETPPVETVLGIEFRKTITLHVLP